MLLLEPNCHTEKNYEQQQKEGKQNKNKKRYTGQIMKRKITYLKQIIVTNRYRRNRKY